MVNNGKNVELKKESIKKLIRMYQERPCLWKLNHENYTNKNIKNKEQEEIVEAFREEYPDINSNIIKQKWQNLRSSYRKQIKRMEASERSGTGVDEIYVPTLWYFDLLSFTRNQDHPLDSISNFDDSQSSVVGGKQGNEEMEQFFTTPESKKKRTKEIEKDLSAFMKTCTKVINTPTPNTDDCSALGTYVAQKLRKMDDTQQILAEALIQKIVIKGLKKQLTDYTDIVETSLTYQPPSTRITFQQPKETITSQQLSTPPIIGMTVQQSENNSPYGSPTGSSTSS